MDVATVFAWARGLGLATITLLIAAGLLKYAGVDFLWNVLATIGNWIVAGFQTLVFASPAPVKLVIFLLLFSTIGGVVVPVTLGAYGVCDAGGGLWVTNSYFEGVGAQMLVGAVSQGDGVVNVEQYSLGRTDNASLVTRGGLVVPQADTYGSQPVLVTRPAGYAGDLMGLYPYAVCYNAANATCVVRRENPVVFTIGSDDSTSKTPCEDNGEVVLARYEYKSDASIAQGVTTRLVGDYFEVEGGSGDLSECVHHSSDQVEVNVTVQQGGFFGFFTSAVPVHGWVTASRAVGLMSLNDFLEGTGAGSLSLNGFLQRDGAGFVKTPLSKQTSLIQYECEGVEKNVTLYGLPVFDPWVMLIISIVAVFFYLWFK